MVWLRSLNVIPDSWDYPELNVVWNCRHLQVVSLFLFFNQLLASCKLLLLRDHWLLTWFILIEYLMLFVINICEGLLFEVFFIVFAIELLFKVFVLFTTITTATALLSSALHLLCLVFLHIVMLVPIRVSIIISFKVLCYMLLRLLIVTVWMLVTLLEHHAHFSSVYIYSLTRVFSNHI